MGERKVLIKYFPPDFDPALVPKGKWDPYKQIETRMMLPFSIQCNTCGEYMYRGKKFNSRKEDVQGEDYKGIRLYRFYIKCITCSSEITFKTDPENMDYAMETGAKRMFEVWKEQEKTEKEAAEKREAEEKADPMKALEHRTIDSRIEMDIQDALEEMHANKGKRDAIRPDDLLAMRQKESDVRAAEEEEEDDALVKSVFQQKVVRRLSDSDEEDGGGDSGKASSARDGGGNGASGKLPAASRSLVSATPEKSAKPDKPIINVKKRRRIDAGASQGGGAKAVQGGKAVTGDPGNGSVGAGAATSNVPSRQGAGGGGGGAAATATAAPSSGANGLGALLGAYGSGSDSD